MTDAACKTLSTTYLPPGQQDRLYMPGPSRQRGVAFGPPGLRSHPAIALVCRRTPCLVQTEKTRRTCVTNTRIQDGHAPQWHHRSSSSPTGRLTSRRLRQGPLPWPTGRPPATTIPAPFLRRNIPNDMKMDIQSEAAGQVMSSPFWTVASLRGQGLDARPLTGTSSQPELSPLQRALKPD